MKNIVDFTSHESLKTFPWESVYEGLARAEKTITTFYGDEHSKRHDTNDGRWKNRNEWRWYNVLKSGLNVEGFNVNLNSFLGDYWWARIHEPVWVPTNNFKLFNPLIHWISSSGIFKHTGRILFFIQLANQGSPNHIDFDVLKVPENLRKPSDFLWITPPDNPKTLTINGEQAPWACWFNHFLHHGSAPKDIPQWSLRIDGEFSQIFRRQYDLF